MLVTRKIFMFLISIGHGLRVYQALNNWDLGVFFVFIFFFGGGEGGGVLSMYWLYVGDVRSISTIPS